MIRHLTLIALGSLALAACNAEPENISADATPDPMADALANAPAIELPAAIAKTKIYRCKDSSVVTIDWLEGGKGANFRTSHTAAPVQLKPDADGGAFVAAGYKLSGSAAASSIMVEQPGKKSQSCKG